MIRRLRPVLGGAVLIGVGFATATPAAAQTVIYPDPPPRADTARSQARDTVRRDTMSRRDTARTTPSPYGIIPAPPTPPAAAAAPAPAPAPAPPLPADPILSRVCADAAPGESAPDVLGIVFKRSADSAARESALTKVEGKRIGGSVADEFQYAHVPAGGSEFRLRALADKLIRVSSVSEVGPVPCPSIPARPPAGAPARADSASS